MRVFISADIEGVCGISCWEEARPREPDYAPFRRQMQLETAAACEAALAAGATHVVVKDAHGPARNLRGAELPAPTQLISGWSGHPFCMVQNLDESFDAALFIGYHGRAGVGGNPLAHTLSSRIVREIRLNGEPASEYRIHAWAAALVGVPVVFVSGDQTLCDEVARHSPGARRFVTKWGEGPSQQSVHPQVAIDGIRDGARAALAGDRAAARLELPQRFTLDVVYKEHARAYARSFYPGCVQLDPHTIRLETDDYFEVLRALRFVVA
ncbi:MAG: M55 family metallopeptidase [Myxococcales bacterium]|nr:M55 family metallopeptidase [Myxococcales bacterium]MCB9749119.1 M55 family metallopeptidase [Myxococcales bacterium]